MMVLVAWHFSKKWGGGYNETKNKGFLKNGKIEILLFNFSLCEKTSLKMVSHHFEATGIVHIVEH